jgi:pilus assembly protein CpaF
MLSVQVLDARGVRQLQLDRFPVVIGKGNECQVQLPGWRVAKKHAEIHRVEKSLRLIDCGSLNGTWVNGERIVEFGPLLESDEIVIGGVKLHISLTSEKVDFANAPGDGETKAPRELGKDDSYTSLSPLRRQIHRKLLQSIDLRRTDVRQLSAPQLRLEVRETIESVLAEEASLPLGLDRERLINDMLDEALGLGPLEALLADDSVTEIMVNSATEIFIEREGRLSRCDAVFTGDEAVRMVLERIVAPLGRRIDEASPMVDARLADGSRVNAVIPPLAIRGPTITIRKFNRRALAPEDLIAFGSSSVEMMEFLQLCVQERLNIVVSGGTGSGKTTLLNVLSNLIPEHERVVTIEDAAELRLHHEHLVSLEARPANLEGRGAITIRDLVRNSLRMRPDRIVVGECRGGEALDMLQAMNTGHDGSLTTVHANSPRDAISRLEVLVLMAGMDLPVTAIREQVAAAVDIIIQQARSSDGSRRITHVVEVSGIESGRVQLQDLFKWESNGRDAQGKWNGRFRTCGVVPSFYEKFAERGIAVNYELFAGTSA